MSPSVYGVQNPPEPSDVVCGENFSATISTSKCGHLSLIHTALDRPFTPAPRTTTLGTRLTFEKIKFNLMILLTDLREPIANVKIFSKQDHDAKIVSSVIREISKFIHINVSEIAKWLWVRPT